MSDFASALRFCSFLNWALRDDRDCSSSNALSLRLAADAEAAEDCFRLEREGRPPAAARRAVERERGRGVCLEAVKNCGFGDWRPGLRGGRLGVLKFEMSLRKEEERGGWWEDDGCRSENSIDCCPGKLRVPAVKIANGFVTVVVKFSGDVRERKVEEDMEG